jgi:hypothetical protein
MRKQTWRYVQCSIVNWINNIIQEKIKSFDVSQHISAFFDILRIILCLDIKTEIDMLNVSYLKIYIFDTVNAIN